MTRPFPRNPISPALHRPLVAALSLAFAAGACVPPEEATTPDQAPESTEQALSSDRLVNFQPTYIGVFRPGTARVEKAIALDKAGYDLAIRDLPNLGSAGFYNASIATHRMGSALRYTGLWLEGRRDQRFLLGRDSTQFSSEYNTLIGQGYRIVSIAATAIGTTSYYSGIFERGSGTQDPRFGRTRSQFDSERATFRNQGKRLAVLTTHVVDRQVRYSGVYVPSTIGQEVVMDLQGEPMRLEIERQRGLGRFVNVISTQVIDDIVRHTVLFNSTGGHAWVSFGQPYVDFQGTEAGERPKGVILGQIQISHVEGLALNRLAQISRDNLIAGGAVGIGVAVRNGINAFTDQRGLRRTATNPPSRNATATDRTNSASVTKNVTAIAVLQLLAQRGLTIDARVQQFVPSDWRRAGNNMDTLTFRQLLTHTSGLKQAGNNPNDFLDYNNLRAMFLAGRGTGTFSGAYFNSNFALFRIIIPFMAGTVTEQTALKDVATANAYINYINSKVFAQAGRANTSSRPAATEPTLHYPPTPTSASGVTQGDLTLQSGGGFLEMSADDIAQILQRRADGTLLTTQWRDIMDINGMGWDSTSTMVRHGTSMKWKGGFIPCNWAAANCAINTLAASFGDVHYGHVINSGVNVNILNQVVDAYNRSWVPTY
jgi:CubicO group peptidase (beta-lactamase class C family)